MVFDALNYESYIHIKKKKKKKKWEKRNVKRLKKREIQKRYIKKKMNYRKSCTKSEFCRPYDNQVNARQ
jgi:hypothetical protein